MFEKFSHSWELVKSSASVLRSDKELLIFPLLSAICCIIVAASFFVPAVLGGLFAGMDEEGANPLLYVMLFAFYVVQYFVIIFFNAALIGAAMIRLDGGDPTVADGFRIARSKLPAILGYAVIAATVGVALRALQERAGFIGRFVIGMIGLAWTVASFLVVPVLVSQDIGPIDAVKRSAELLKKTWGQNLIGTGGIGIVFGLAIFAFALIGGGLIALAISSGILAITITTIVAVVIVFLLLILIQAALQGVYAAALYRFATEGDAGEGFDKGLVAGAFKVKA
ncbi:DUF6159 family protein [Dokdonella sp.]|uniref:DUF6159 family protein n=1 Tax=Dokdonella sp. TaxID=2291710 RepID=UPI003C530F90